MEESAVKGKLREWVVSRSKVPVTVAEFDDDTPIIEGGYLSSLDIVEFVLYVESLRGGEVDMDDLEPEMFVNTNTMYEAFFASAV
ncbi:MAG: hypothetical protein RIE74_04995 [Pseudomonadales bacterium]